MTLGARILYSRGAHDRLLVAACAIFIGFSLVGCGRDDTPDPAIRSGLDASPTQASTQSASDAESIVASPTSEVGGVPTPAGSTGGPSTDPAAASVAEASIQIVSGFDVNGDGGMNRGELILAMKARIGEFAWPPAYHMTEAIVEDVGSSFMPGAGYENGYEITVLKLRNNCAWFLAWFDARRAGDAEAEAEAMRMLREVVPYSVVFDRSTTDYLIEIVDKAARGNTAPLQQYAQTNFCYQQDFASATPDAE